MNLLISKDYSPPPTVVAYTEPFIAFAALQAHAKAYGYAFIIRDTKPNKISLICITYACDKQGKSISKGLNPSTYLQR